MPRNWRQPGLISGLLALLLSGCKIVIETPPEGGVVNTTGSIICEAESACTISVVDTFFNETYEAEPNDGRVFTGWKVRDRGLCGGSLEDCALTTAGFGGIPALLSILASDSEFYLEPTFGLAPEHYQVTRVVDGDTIVAINHVGEEVRIRLPGIDAPEDEQPYGEAATQRLEELAGGQMVRIVGDTYDRYERLLGELYSLAGERLSIVLVREGYAWWSEYYAADDEDLQNAHNNARAQRRGLWSHPQPIPPWDWRQGVR